MTSTLKFKIVITWSLLGMYLLYGCYGVNEKTSSISSLDPRCVDSTSWDAIYKTYSTDKIKDSIFIDKIKAIRKEPFETDVLYFNENPKELIAISREHYGIRYVYNPKISSEILNGFSQELQESEKRRIRNRIYRIIMNYQCSEGKENSRKVLKMPVGE